NPRRPSWPWGWAGRGSAGICCAPSCSTRRRSRSPRSRSIARLRLRDHRRWCSRAAILGRLRRRWRRMTRPCSATRRAWGLPAAGRWKDQFNENAKTFAVWNTFPELNHNETVGWGLDDALARLLHVIILRDAVEPPRLALRAAITRDLALSRAGGLDEVHAAGTGKLARLLSAVLIGDFVSWYLAVLREVDPTPVAVIDELKKRLARG